MDNGKVLEGARYAAREEGSRSGRPTGSIHQAHHRPKAASELSRMSSHSCRKLFEAD